MSDQEPIVMFDPVTARAIADRLQVVPSAVSNWMARHSDFPAPLIDLGRTKVWEWEHVESWWNAHIKPRRWIELDSVILCTFHGEVHPRQVDWYECGEADCCATNWLPVAGFGTPEEMDGY